MEIPEGAFLQEISAHYNALSFPRHLRALSSLPAQTWGQVRVEEGELELLLEGAATPVLVDAAGPAVIPPQMGFRLKPKGKGLVFFLEFHHERRLGEADLLAAALGNKAVPR